MRNLPSVMSHRFSQAPQADVPRSSFNRSHGYKTAFDAGYLVPFYIDEVLPGDTFNLKAHVFARMATPVFPLMDNLFMESFFFFVPLRLIWNNFERFMGAQDDPGDSTDYVCPIMTSPVGGYLTGSLSDYLGLPILKAGLSHVSFFHRAYNLIWNNWFRDENLQNSVVVDKDDGPDSPTDYVLLRRGKRYDYFTSCLPFPQKGPSVELPLGDYAPVIGIGTGNSGSYPRTNVTVRESTGSPTVVYSTAKQINAAAGEEVYVAQAGTSGYPNIRADLSTATASTINALREAFQIQKLYERDARGGTRYVEILGSHFNIRNHPDARLQRPEYLGGGSTPININPIPQTSSTDGTSPQGNLAAFGTVSFSNHGFTKSFVEHGVIIGLVSVRADLNYQQGLNRMFSRSTRFDFYWPVLSHLGEQAVLNKEIFAQATSADDDVFGYQERWAEYRYKPSLVTGLMRSDAASTIDKWHLAQDFASLPVLNDSFIQEDPPVDRVIAVPTQPHFIFDSFIKLKTVRNMPVYSVPGLVDHF